MTTPTTANDLAELMRQQADAQPKVDVLHHAHNAVIATVQLYSEIVSALRGELARQRRDNAMLTERLTRATNQVNDLERVLREKTMSKNEAPDATS